jgi:hypothetical protein
LPELICTLIPIDPCPETCDMLSTESKINTESKFFIDVLFYMPSRHS